jgi:hypothetical protein
VQHNGSSHGQNQHNHQPLDREIQIAVAVQQKFTILLKEANLMPG